MLREVRLDEVMSTAVPLYDGKYRSQPALTKLYAQILLSPAVSMSLESAGLTVRGTERFRGNLRGSYPVDIGD